MSSSNVNIISSHIAVAPNEYVTKFSINRNFLKLIENDRRLSAAIEESITSDAIHSFIQGHEYHLGDCVFYKTSSSSLSLYLLSCIVDSTVELPYLYTNSAGDIVVRSSDNWKIVGIPEDLDVNPKDYAIEYVKKNKNDFILNHLNCTDILHHPTGKLGVNDSTITFTTLDNISNDRETFFYPNLLLTLNSDNTIIAGYMRKWQNGLLEYDIIFKVGSNGDKTSDGSDIISANNFIALHRDLNYLYFKDKSDFEIFNLINELYVAINKTKQVNLNNLLNAYYGLINFPEEFKDLNYMVFTTQEKNIELESINVKNEVLRSSEYDSRLKIEGLTITGYDETASFEKKLEIPNRIVNIGKYALASILQSNAIELKILFDVDNSDLVNIEDYAFLNTAFKKILIPKNTKCIGYKAFSNCTKLENIDIYVNKDIGKQVVIDYDAFLGTNSLSSINLYYFVDDVLMFSSANDSADESELRISAYSNELDLSAKLMDRNFLKVYGINLGDEKLTEIIIHDVNYLLDANTDSKTNNVFILDYDDLDNLEFFNLNGKILFGAKNNSISCSLILENELDSGILYVEDFLNQFQKPKLAFASSNEVQYLLSDYFYFNGTILTGWNTETLKEKINLDFSEESLSNITIVEENALKDCNYISSINIPTLSSKTSKLETIKNNAFSGCNIDVLSIHLDSTLNKIFSSKSLSDTFIVNINFYIENTNRLLYPIYLSSYNFVENVNIYGKASGSIIDSNFHIAIPKVENLNLYNIDKIYTLALLYIEHINNLYIDFPYNTTILGQSFFANISNKKYNLHINKSENTYIEFEALSLSYICNDDDNLFTLDLANTLILRNAFYKFESRLIKFTNWKNGKVITTSVGGINPYQLTCFAQGAFNGSYINTIYFSDILDMSELSANLIVGTNKNVLSCEDETNIRSIQGEDISKVYGYTVFNGEIIDLPKSKYVYINDENIVVSCYWNIISSYVIEEQENIELAIPYGVKEISSNAFSYGMPINVKLCVSAIGEIKLPSSLKRIRLNAFNNISCLDTIIFDNGTNLSEIEDTIFNGTTRKITEFLLLKN